MPRWRIDPARASISSALKCLRGLRGLGAGAQPGSCAAPALARAQAVVVADEGRHAASEPGTHRLLRHGAAPCCRRACANTGRTTTSLPDRGVGSLQRQRSHTPRTRNCPARKTRNKPGLLIEERAWAGPCGGRRLSRRRNRRPHVLWLAEKWKGLLSLHETRGRNPLHGGIRRLPVVATPAAEGPQRGSKHR